MFRFKTPREKQFRKEFEIFSGLSVRSSRDFRLQWEERHPCLDDRTATTEFDRHYIYHTAWAARILADARPAVHVDISSSLYFCAIVSAFTKIEFYDFRKPDLVLDNLQTESADLTALPFESGSISSLSCMHVIEHIGLGRYGDALDPEGDLKAMRELARVTAPGGRLLIVVPVGRERIAYNAHRIYGYEQIVNNFAEFQLAEFSLIPDSAADGGLVRWATPDVVNRQNYGCGCFWFIRNCPS